MRVNDLKAFSQFIYSMYADKQIPSPIHLSGGNEKHLIKLFRRIKPLDWIFSTYRSHYHWLLSGRGMIELSNKILNGKSMRINDKRFLTSSIVAGTAPIALGVALALRIKKSPSHAWCFLGDMAASSGIVSECIRYAQGHDLPVTYVIEDNGMSVGTNTQEVWGKKNKRKTIRYKYKREYPHHGIGKAILF
jgi:TPP-dependent pyruvate/acetoin dehydrogenase alpha subunit